MRIVIAGGSGFLGRALSGALLRDGHEVVVLTRGGAASAATFGAPARVTWNPNGSAGPWASAIEGAGAVINLAGESIGSGRWTGARKAALVESRLLATRSVVAAIARVRQPPRVMISASAQGYYGDRGDQALTESEPPGDDFLARLCVQWEAEARRAEEFCRVVLLRSGIVLSAEEGALPRLLLPFRMFAGGPMGSGRQFMAWIHWLDWAAMTAWALNSDAVSGPLNISAPVPVRNKDVAAAIGRRLHRPALMRTPAFALRLALGEMADALLLTSIRMLPERALQLGYRFTYPQLDEALRDLVA